MKSNQKNLSHMIRSVEDALGFDYDDNVSTYERICSTKKYMTDDVESIEKKRSKLRDNRRTEISF
jgi:hypothetical protein